MSDNSNQTAKADAGKAPISLVPMDAVWAVSWIRKYGNEKYHDPDNWIEVEPERYRNAMMRHLLCYLENYESIDEESGYPHLWHAACNMFFLISLEYGEETKTDYAAERIDLDAVFKNLDAMRRQVIEKLCSRPNAKEKSEDWLGYYNASPNVNRKSLLHKLDNYDDTEMIKVKYVRQMIGYTGTYADDGKPLQR